MGVRWKEKREGDREGETHDKDEIPALFTHQQGSILFRKLVLVRGVWVGHVGLLEVVLELHDGSLREKKAAEVAVPGKERRQIMSVANQR